MRSALLVPFVACASGLGAHNETSDLVCEWPTCMPHCVPCERKETAGTCYTSGIFGSLGDCNPERGPTDCFLGKCLCKDGYCPDETGEKCKPQICVRGAEPPPFVPNEWLVIFSSMSNLDPFPPYEELMDIYVTHILQIIPVPLMLLLIGMVVSCATFACICCGGASGYHYSMDFSDVQHDETEGFISGTTKQKLISDEEFAQRAWKRRPACLPMFCTALLIVVMCLVGIPFRYTNWLWSEWLVLESLERAEENAVEISDACLTINQTISELHDDLSQLVTSCKTDNKAVKHILYVFTVNALGAINQYVDQVYTYVDMVVPIPDQIKKFRTIFSGQRQIAVRLPLVPLLLMAGICSLIVLEATMTTCCRSSSLTRCVDKGLKLAAVLFALIILVVAILIFVETVMMIVLSKFCEDVDHNVLSYVNSTTYDIASVIPELATYYIRGAERNPVMEYDALARKYINQIQDYYDKANLALMALGHACPAFNKLDIDEIAVRARGILDRARGLLQGSNIYPYYRKVIRMGICDVIIDGVGWMWLLQVVTGLILFPLCAVLTHKFLVGWAAWIKVKEARRERMNQAGVDGASSDSDEEDSDSDEELSEKSPISGRQMSGAGRRWLPRSLA